MSAGLTCTVKVGVLSLEGSPEGSRGQGYQLQALKLTGLYCRGGRTERGNTSLMHSVLHL